MPFPSPMQESEKRSEVAQSCPTLRDPIDCQAPPSMGFSRQECWSGVRLPSPNQFSMSDLTRGRVSTGEGNNPHGGSLMVVSVMPMSLSISAETIPFCSNQNPSACPACTRPHSHTAPFAPGSHTTPFSPHLRRTSHTQLAGVTTRQRWGGGNVCSVFLKLGVSTLHPWAVYSLHLFP